MRTTRWNLLPCKHGLGRISQFQGGLVSLQWKQDKESMNIGRTWVSLAKKRKICMGLFPSLCLPSSNILSCLMSLLCFRVGQHNRTKVKGELASCSVKQSVTLAAASPYLQVQINRFLLLVLLPGAALFAVLFLSNLGFVFWAWLVIRLRMIYFKEKKPYIVTYFEGFVPVALLERF